jgi:CRISPR system Cascade subunit CasC
MDNSKNSFLGQRIEYHILQSFPVTCLNRDDIGAPKTAKIGGTTRARVSSQCWKRQVRLLMHDNGVKIGMRTKLISDVIAKECEKLGATIEQASKCAESAASFFGKVENGTNDTLLFITETEAKAVAQAFAEKGFIANEKEEINKEQIQTDENVVLTKEEKIEQKKLSKKEKAEAKKDQVQIAKIMQDALNPAIDGLDIALFGRMVANAMTMKVDAAASFSHAISTHVVSNEIEFFTAVDDNKISQGSAHLGSLEFNSATYYRYIDLDLGQLWTNLLGHNILDAVEAFTKAIFNAYPSARQTTMSGTSPWNFARIYIRNGQRLQASFEKAVRVKDGSILEPSIEVLKTQLDTQEKLWGSLFGEKGMIEYGDKNIDEIIAFLKAFIEENYKN